MVDLIRFIAGCGLAAGHTADWLKYQENQSSINFSHHRRGNAQRERFFCNPLKISK
jgi:hypothetical protein